MMSDYDTLSAMNTTPLDVPPLKHETAKRYMFRLYPSDRYMLMALAILMYNKSGKMSSALRSLISEEAQRRGITPEMARQIVRNAGSIPCHGETLVATGVGSGNGYDL